MIVENGAFVITYNVEAEVERPNVMFDKISIYCGILPKGKPFSEKIQLRSKSYERVQWMIMEVVYNPETCTFVEFCCSCHFKQFSGVFTEFDETLDLEYHMKTEVFRIQQK